MLHLCSIRNLKESNVKFSVMSIAKTRRPETLGSVFSIDGRIPKLNVAGSIPVSRSRINNLRAWAESKNPIRDLLGGGQKSEPHCRWRARQPRLTLNPDLLNSSAWRSNRRAAFRIKLSHCSLLSCSMVFSIILRPCDLFLHLQVGLTHRLLLVLALAAVFGRHLQG